MNAFFQRAALAAAFSLLGGLAHAAPLPALDKDPAAFLRAVQSSLSPEAKAIQQEIADGAAALVRQRDLAQKEGLAVFPAQLNRPLPPDDRNAAPLYRTLDARRREAHWLLPGYAQRLSARYAYTPAQLVRVQQVMDAHPDMFALLRQATDRPLCVFGRDYTKDAFLFPAQFAGLRESARELKAEAVLLAEQGHYLEAVAVQARGSRLAEHAASEPTLISYLVAQSLDEITTRGLEDILTLAGPNAAVDAQVQQALTGRAAHLSLRHGLSGEAALADASFALLRRAGPAELPSLFTDADTASRLPKPQFTPEQRVLYGNLLDAAEADDLARLRQITAAADTPGEAAAWAEASRAGAADPVKMVSDKLSVFQAGALDALPLRGAASRRIALAAAAALAERAKTGAYPLALPQSFTDPYTGKPLGYRREGEAGFVVWSVGPDGKGDGGKPDDRVAPQTGAYRFRYPAIPMPVPQEDQ